MQKLFEQKIKEDEKIIAVYRAGKGYKRTISFAGIGLSFLIIPIPIFSYLFFLLFWWVFGMGSASKKNYFVCLTDSRLIIRHGVLGVNYKEYDLENFGNVSTGQSVFEKKDSTSCHLSIERKAFHMDSHGQPQQMRVDISTLENGYDLAKKLASVKKNNKNLVVEIKK